MELSIQISIVKQVCVH